MSITVHYQHNGLARTPTATDVRRWVDAAGAAAAAGRDIEVCVRIVDRDEGRSLNARYRGGSEATNVLSFAAELPAELALALLGDIVICAPVVEHEAAAQHKAPEAHWAHMVVHGMLHLLGYDHADDAGAQRMETLETRILTGMNYPPPYRDSTCRSDHLDE